MPARIFSSEDLPVPLRPISPTRSPVSREKLAPSSRATWPKARWALEMERTAMARLSPMARPARPRPCHPGHPPPLCLAWSRLLPTGAALDVPATLVLVEGDSDAAALQALAGLTGLDLVRHGLQIRPAHGVTNFPRVLREFLQAQPGAGCCGLYDVADVRHVRRALLETGLLDSAQPVGPALETCGFFACEADLEDELIRALGPEAVQRVIAAEGEL